jgi:hypothetical protein
MEEELLAEQADTEGWYDKLKNARLTGRAMDSAQHNDAKEKAAAYPTSPDTGFGDVGQQWRDFSRHFYRSPRERISQLRFWQVDAKSVYSIGAQHYHLIYAQHLKS